MGEVFTVSIMRQFIDHKNGTAKTFMKDLFISLVSDFIYGIL